MLMDVGSEVLHDNNPVNFHDFFPNDSRVNAHQNPNLDFTVEFKLFNTVIKATPVVGFTDFKQENSQLKSEEDNNNNSNVSDHNNVEFIDLSLNLSVPNNTEVNHGGDSALPDEEVLIEAVPLNMYNPLNDDIEWTIMKRLTISDCDGQSRLLISKRAMETHILPLLSESNRLKIKSPKGLRINVLDCDIRYELQLTLKKWGSTPYYGLMEHWTRNFVNPRSLIPGDVVGLCWDVDSNRLFFSVLWRNRNRIHQNLTRKEKRSRKC